MKTATTLHALIVSLLFAVGLNVQAQTTLAPGDIAIVAYNFDNPDEYAFVALVDIAAGTVINFTDNGWFSSGSFRANEGTQTYTAATNISAGDVVVLTASGPAFANSGDQILAYQGTSGSPSFVYALNSDGTTWAATATSAADSALPTGLVDGTSAVSIPEVDNAYYSGITSGTQAELLAAIGNPSNWTTNDTGPLSTALWPSSFSVNTGSPTPGLTITEASGSTDVTEGGATDTFTIELSTTPTDIVNITVAGDSDVNVSPTNFQLAASGVPQVITVTAVDDADVEGNHSGFISISTASADADYNGLNGNVTADVTDNESVVVDADIIINEVDSDTPSTDTAEFVELYDGGRGNISLDGLVLVFFNGSNDTSYLAIDLDGYTTDANGFFVAGNAGVTQAAVNFNDNTIQNGADGVALYVGDGADFPNGTAATGTDIVDAVVYDTSDSDDTGLLNALTPGQPQINESGGSNGSAGDSISRVPDGGTQLDTSNYVAQAPTPGATNGAADTAAPVIESLFPADDAVNVFPNSPLTICFDEDVQAVTGGGNIFLKLASDNSTVESFDVETVALISDSVVQVVPASPLTAGAAYYVQIDSGTIEDTSTNGNDFAGIADTTTWSFTVSSGTIYSDSATQTVSIESTGPNETTNFYAQNTGGSFDEYSLAEFSLDTTDFGNATITNINKVELVLAVEDRSFNGPAEYVILFTRDSAADLQNSAAYDALTFDPLAAYGINAGAPQYVTSPMVVSGPNPVEYKFSGGAGFEDRIILDLSTMINGSLTLEDELITAINSGDSFLFIIGQVNSVTGAVTYLGVSGSTADDPTLEIDAVTNAASPGVLISESDNSTDVSEDGASDTYTIVLATQPTDDVTVSLSYDNGQLSTSPSQYVFTNSDWNTPKTITVNAQNDATDEATVHTATITHSVSSSDGDYNAISVDSVTVNITDNDFTPISGIVINEFVADHTGSDSDAFIELFGSASTDYSDLTLLEIEGDSGSTPGVIDAVFSVGTTNANGFWVVGTSAITNADLTSSAVDAENDNITYILVQDFSGNIGDDLDADNDGALDVTPWSAVIDSVGVEDSSSAGFTYGQTTLTPTFDGSTFTVGGASRMPDGTDTNSSSDWVRNDFSGDGLPSFGSTGTTTSGEAFNTPGATNAVFVETPGILLSADPTSFSENGGTSTLTVTLSAEPAGYPLTVNLNSADTGEVTVTASVTFNNTADFTNGLTATLTGVDDAIFDGGQSVTITGSASGYDDGTTEVTVTDDEAFTDPGNVYISQYYHATGSGFGEMWVEICVPTGETVDFTGYTLAVWSDGDREGWKTDSGTPTTIDLSSLGTNVSGPVAFLVSDGFAVQPGYATADISDLALLFDGDDSIALYSGSATAANLVDVISLTSTDTATDTSIVRTATGVGFDLTAGSSYADFPGIWSVESTANVDGASSTDNIYLGFCDFGSAPAGFTSYIANQSGAGGDGETDDKNGDGIINRDSYVFDIQNDGTTTTGAGAGRPFSELFGNAFVDANVTATPDDITDDRFGFVFEVPTTVPTDGEIQVSVSDTIGGTPALLATYSGSTGTWTPANGGTVITDPDDANRVIIYDNQNVSASSSRFMTFGTVITTP